MKITPSQTCRFTICCSYLNSSGHPYFCLNQSNSGCLCFCLNLSNSGCLYSCLNQNSSGCLCSYYLMCLNNSGYLNSGYYFLSFLIPPDVFGYEVSLRRFLLFMCDFAQNYFLNYVKNFLSFCLLFKCLYIILILVGRILSTTPY